MTGNRKNFRLTFAIAVVLLLGVAVMLTNVLDKFSTARVDMTSEKLYTMSPAARSILQGLEVPVQVKLYISNTEQMPTELKTLERDIVDKLRDYSNASDGLLEFSVHDPQDDEEMQENLASRNINPIRAESVDKDEFGVKLIWSAMTIAYKDYPEEIIPRVLPANLATLEYNLVSRIFRLTREAKPVVALVAPRQEVDQQTAMRYLQQGMQPPEPVEIYGLVAQLLEQEHYEVKRVELTRDSQIPEDADVLVVLNPTRFEARQAWEINRALSNGLNTVIAVQHHVYGYQPGGRGSFMITGQSQASGLEGMLAGLGVVVDDQHLFDVNTQMLSVPRTETVGGMRFQTNEPVDLPMQILVSENQMNQDAPITGRISNLLYLWGSALDLNRLALDEHGLNATPLFTASDDAWRWEYKDGIVPGSYFLPENKESEAGLPLMVSVAGSFPDTFRDGDVPDWTAAPVAPDEVNADVPQDELTALNPAPAQLLVVGCAKMFDDMALQAGQNGLMLLNAVDALAFGEELISIRAKTMTARTIRNVSDTEKVGYRLFVVLLVPALLVVFGLLRTGARRKEVKR